VTYVVFTLFFPELFLQVFPGDILAAESEGDGNGKDYPAEDDAEAALSPC
jgi:hypothetical protein